MTTEVDIPEALRLQKEYLDSLNMTISAIDPTTCEQWYGWHLAVISAAAHAALFRGGVELKQDTPDGPRNRLHLLRMKLLDVCNQFVEGEKS